MRGLISSVFATFAVASLASQTSPFAGDYAGMLGPIHVKLHLAPGADGALTGTADSPDQNLIGMPCSNIHVDGQALSFSVPIVHGTWTGFLSADGNSLAGMWSQGNALQLNFTRVTSDSSGGGGSIAAAAPPVTGSGEVSWDDYVFKFDQSGTMAQVFQAGKLVGTILTYGGQQRVIPLPGTDAAKLQKSFDDYRAFAARSHSSGSSPAATSVTPPSSGSPAGALPGAPSVPPPGSALGFQTNGTADPSGIQFSDATHEIMVPRTDGVTVTFAAQDVRIGSSGRGFILRRQKGGAGRFLEHTFDHSNSVGGSLSGGGIEFLYAGGGLIYDSGMGGRNLQENSQVRLAKQLSSVAVDAVAAIRTVKGHENFTPPGYDAMKEISQYRLRSDGSR